ncbi:MAG: DUF1269 domain-containing protein [Cyclobacteriaceae bacterium]
MNKILVAVFENETTAHEGLSALKDLHQDGDITLYATAVISKDQNGELQLKTAADRGAVGAATGLLAGSLIGLIGGPVGLAIGAASGFLGGLIFDISSDDINIQFVDEVSGALTKGKTAVIAEIDESWTVPVDTRLAKAMVFRRLKNEVFDEQLARESEAIAAEYQKLEEELAEAGKESKAQIESAIAKLKDKAQLVDAQLRKKLNEIYDTSIVIFSPLHLFRSHVSRNRNHGNICRNFQ